MDFMDQLGGLLQKYTGQSSGQQNADVDQDFDQIAQNAPKSTLTSGLAAAFRSDQTPPFAQMVGSLFGQSSGEQKAGLLNQLLAMGVGSQMIGSLFGGKNQITPQEAEKVAPDQVQNIAAEAENRDPSIVDRLSEFYSEHPTLVKSLGAGALGITLGKIAERYKTSGGGS